MQMRRVVAATLITLAALSALAGVGFLFWAGNRPYADNQRNWGYLLGVFGIVFAAVLAGVGALVGRRKTTV